MRRRFFLCSIIALFFIMLFFPQTVFEGASKGLLLWFQIVLPTLLPFIMISNLMIYTNAISYIARAAGPLLHRILGVSGCGSFVVLAGFLCGYPMGAKVTSDLLKTKRISLREGQYLLSFCNNTSPMFIISYVMWQNVKMPALLLPSVVILMLSPLLCSFFFRLCYNRSCRPAFDDLPASDTCTKVPLTILDTCMMDSFEAIVKVGGYIMLFSIFISLAQSLPFVHPLLHQCLLPMLEVTNGIPMLCNLNAPALLRWVLVLALTSFGGLCAAAQTGCMIQGSGLSMIPYIIEKLITMVVTSLLAYVYLLLF